MIWFVLGVLLLGLMLFVVAPLLREAPVSDALSTARAQLAQLESDLEAGRISPAMATQTREALEQRVLGLLQAEDGAGDKGEQAVQIARFAAPILLLVGAIGLYLYLGTPNYRAQPVPDPIMVASDLEVQSLEELVVKLEQRLAGDEDAPAMGYVLLARSLMNLQRYDDAIAAYETALGQPDAVPEISTELDEARAFIAGGGPNGMPMLDRETVETVQSMSNEDQAAMIEGMVAGLAMRLEADPSDIEGWARLIRARIVLGDTAQAERDLAAAVAAAEGNPEAETYLQQVADDLGLASSE